MSISEYGRNIQKMIERIMEVEDREKRNQLARATIQVMGQLNPHLRDVNDFKHKLWDHLFIMSDFKLDVDSPYPKPSAESLQRKPQRLEYSKSRINFRHYGQHIERIIEKACEMEDGAEKSALIRLIAIQLKKSYLAWNRDAVTDEEIASHLQLLSAGRLKLADDVRIPQSPEPATNPAPVKGKKKKYQPRQGGGKVFNYRNRKTQS